MSSNKDKISLFQLITSVSAAMFGVQSDKNRERDFAKGNIWHFIIIGVVLALVFIGVLITVVKIVLS